MAAAKGSGILNDREITIAAFGGNGGNPYEFHGIKQIIVTYSNESLEGITLVDEDGNKLKLGGRYSRPTKSDTINLAPEEYLTGIRGTIGIQDTHTVVKSIGFVTNNNQDYGPYGPTIGTPFSTQIEAGGKITGFHGVSAWLVDSIGVYVKPISSLGSEILDDHEITIAAFGGSGGNPYEFHAFKQIIATYSTESLESITLIDEDGNKLKLGGQYSRPTKSDTINLAPEEYLTGIRGTIGIQDTHTVVKSIGFVTNNNKYYGPYGPAIGTPFSTQIEAGGKITGFHGVSAWLVDSIGVYVKPISLLGNGIREITIAAFGGSGGDLYTFHAIKQIIVTYSNESLESITLTDEDGNKLKLGGRYSRPTKSDTINLAPEEYLIGIRGTIGIQDTHTVVKSIGFVTNNNKDYGPYGPATGTPFSTQIKAGGKITGFHGRSAWLVDSIGVYMKPV